MTVHTLIVGGTGMLRGVTESCLERGHDVSIVARSPAQFPKGFAHAVLVDYRDTAALRAGLFGAIQRHGPIRNAICWIHGSAPDAPLIVANVMAEGGGPCRYIHILGSASADPSRQDTGRKTRFQAFSRLRYQEVILGFVVEDSGVSRWLTHAEICEGVLASLDDSLERRIVGQVEPWEARP